MKFLVTIAAACLSAIIFTTNGSTQEMTAQKKTILNFYDALAQGKVELLDKVLVKDWVTHDANPGQDQGREGFKAFIPKMANSFSDFKWTVEEMIEEGNIVVVRSTFSGTHSGDFMGNAATGKSFTAKAIDVHHFNDQGMVTQTYHLEDWIAVLAQIGALGH